MSAAAHAASAPPWWNKAWRYRKSVRVGIPAQGDDMSVKFLELSILLGERSLTGKAVINVESGIDGLSDQVVVTNAAGEVVPSRAFSRGVEGRATVLFKAEPTAASYYIYYGNEKARLKEMEWQRSPFSLAVATVRVPDAKAISTPASAGSALLAVKEAVGMTGAYAVKCRAKEFDIRDAGDYITVHSGLMVAPVDGMYEFGLDASGTAHLLIDGALVTTVRGLARPAKSWKGREQVRLKRGVHNFTVLHGERAGAQGIRVGWIRPGTRGFVLMSGSAFARGRFVEAEVTGLEEVNRPSVPFFTMSRSDVAFKLRGKEKGMVALKLRSHTRGDGLTFEWLVGAKKLAGRSPTCFVEGEGRHKVTLTVFWGGSKIGSYTRTIVVDSVRHVEVAATFEMPSCPDVVYDAEGVKLAFKLVNPSTHPIPVRFQRVIGKDDSFIRDFEIAAGDEQSLDVELLALPKGTDSAEVTFRLWLAETALAERKVSIIRPGFGVAALTPKAGHLVDRDGWRVVIAIGLENDDDHRKWAALKWMAKKVESNPKKVLLYGDRMMDASGNVAVGYVGLIRRKLAEGDRSLSVVERKAGGIVPCVADLPAFAAALTKHEPGLVVISLGSRDALKGIERVQFARSLDVMIDLARAHASRPAVVLVSPVPLVSNQKISAGHASAARIIAARHRLPFVDLHGLIKAKAAWQDLYKHAADDQVFHLHPNEEAHRMMADAILDAID